MNSQEGLQAFQLRHSLPHTTKRRTTNLKTKINQNCQKIELYGSPTTKELKKKHSSRLVGGAETGSKGEKDIWPRRGWRTGWERWQLADWVVPHLHEDKPGGTTGEWDRQHNPGFQHGKIKPQNLWLKKLEGVVTAGETPSLTEEFIGETHRVLERTQNHPPTNQHQKDPICLWVVEEVTKSRQELSKQHCSLSHPYIQGHNAARWVALPRWIPKAPPLTT